MSSNLLLESAIRVLVMGALIFIALQALRIRQVRAQRAAWLLALLGALVMPLLVAAQIGPKLLPPAPAWERVAPAEAPLAAPLPQTQHARSIAREFNADTTPAAMSAQSPATVLSVMRDLYLFVAITLLARLFFGLGLALFIRARARRLAIEGAASADIRESERVASPVTIASSVLLPMTHSLWDDATLRIILSHERAHVLQRDFYVQLLAGAHCALFWFNPFAWWLKRQLSDLGEALSDHAAVQIAPSRAGYAEMLLTFARQSRRPTTFAATVAVAMARSSNLAPRIDRLLSDQGFERSFAVQRRLPLVAAGAALIAIAAASATSRVAAAIVVEPRQNPPASFGYAPLAETPPAPASAPSPDASAPPAPPAPAAPAAPRPAPRVKPAPLPPLPPKPDVKGTAQVRVIRMQDGARIEADSADVVRLDEGRDDVMAVHIGGSHTMFDEFDEEAANRLRRAYSLAAGDYVYYQENNKRYLVQQAEILEQAKKLMAPIQNLHAIEDALRSQQRAMAARERALAQQERSIQLDTPNFNQQIAALNKIADEMRKVQSSPQMRPEVLAQLQSSLGRIQGDLGRLEAEVGDKQGVFGSQQEALGEEEGKLGEQEEKLGEQHEKLADEMREKLKLTIQQAIKDGRLKPLE
jgi:beta-lactamase regulating signal transducer with metallopeptidase domain